MNRRHFLGALLGSALGPPPIVMMGSGSPLPPIMPAAALGVEQIGKTATLTEALLDEIYARLISFDPGISICTDRKKAAKLRRMAEDWEPIAPLEPEDDSVRAKLMATAERLTGKSVV